MLRNEEGEENPDEELFEQRNPGGVKMAKYTMLAIERQYASGGRSIGKKVARTLEATIRKEDPSRYTMMAYHNAPRFY